MNQFNLNEGAPKSLSAEHHPLLPSASIGKPAGRWPFQARVDPAGCAQGGAQHMPRESAENFVT